MILVFDWGYLLCRALGKFNFWSGKLTHLYLKRLQLPDYFGNSSQTQK